MTGSVLRLLRTFAGVLGEKIRMRAMLKKNITTYISLEVNECRFREKI